MISYDLIVIGFGKAGKTLAAKYANLGKTVALIEAKDTMYGGTCINIGCIPTKTLLVAADKQWTFEQVMTQKETVVTRLRQKNEAGLKGAGVDLYHAKAKFVSNKVIALTTATESLELTAETIVINTGAISHALPIPGLLTTERVYDSTGIQQLTERPKRLGIIGGGNIGLEFASLYAKLGSHVSVFEAAPTLLSRYEPSVAKLAQTYLEEDGITFHLNTKIEEVKPDNNAVVLTANGADYAFDAVLYATGRKPATEGLGLEHTDIDVEPNGAITITDYCETSVPGVYAVGDVNGGPQFTYTSLDDFRIVFGKLTGNSDYHLQKRGQIPTSLFIKPALSRVGLTEQEAVAAGYTVITNELPVANMPRAHVNNDLRGLYKVVIDQETKLILGATLFGEGSQEIINLITMAMDNHIPYTYLKTQLFTHPTMAENLNDLFNI